MTSTDIAVQPADTPADAERLRAFVAARGEAAARRLEAHGARPRLRPALTRLAVRADEVAGYALLAHRRFRLGAATIEAGEIMALDAGGRQEVFVALLGDCLRTLVDEGLPLATIDGAPDDYAPFGFAEYAFESVVELWGDGAHATPLRPATNGDLDDLDALFAATYARIPLAEARAASDWRWWLGAHWLLVLEDSRGRVAGYALVGAGPGDVIEAAAAEAGAARALCAALQAQPETNGELRLHLPPSHLVAEAALHMGATLRLHRPAPSTTMRLAGVVDLPGLLETLAPEFERRLALSRYAGWSGNLRVEIETERITLALESGRAAVIDGSRPADVRLRRVQLPALAQLCLGFRSPADLRATGGLDCDDSTLGLLDALFPTVLASAAAIDGGR